MAKAPLTCRNAYGTDAVHSATASIQRKSSAQPRPVSFARKPSQGTPEHSAAAKPRPTTAGITGTASRLLTTESKETPPPMAMSTGSVVRDVAAGTAAVHSSFQPSRAAFFPCAALPARQRLCAAVTQSTPNVAENERSRLTSTAAYGFCRHKSSAARPSEVSASLFLLNRAPP